MLKAFLALIVFSLIHILFTCNVDCGGWLGRDFRVGGRSVTIIRKSPANCCKNCHFLAKTHIDRGGSPMEIAHVLACGESLWMAVDLLDGVERARAAASAWYAQRFILDLVTRFGRIVHTVCIIRDSVVVVELKPARLTGAIAWAALSGAGT